MANPNIPLSLREIFIFFSGTAKAAPKSKTVAGSKAKNSKPSKSGKPAKKGGGPVSVVGTGCTIIGSVYFENDVRIDGVLQGEVTCESAVIMGSGCEVSGTVKANDITIEGLFDGDLRVKEIIRIKQTAKIHGDIYAPSMSTELGATINGTCNIGGSD